jgi:hypothetical protein
MLPVSVDVAVFQHPEDSCLLGPTMNAGSVTAASGTLNGTQFGSVIGKSFVVDGISRGRWSTFG